MLQKFTQVCLLVAVVDCHAEADRGECEGFNLRFFFSQRTGRCEPFLYGGCGGNGNNYESLEECAKTCNPNGN